MSKKAAKTTAVSDEPKVEYTASDLTASPPQGPEFEDIQIMSNFELLEELLKFDLPKNYRKFGNIREWAEKTHHGKILMELSRRVMLQTLQRSDCLTSTSLTRHYVRARMRRYKREVFLCLFLDNQHRVIAVEELFHGTIDGSAVYPREVVCRSLHHNAAAVIFAHNHPSGMAEPSQSDISITRRLKEALSLVDIRTLDHLVVGDAEVTSLAERGLL